MSGPWFHVDIDAFFASVEQLDDPTLVGRPVIVGARPGGRGVVSTCSYEARAFGIHSAMPIGEAWRRCPTAAFLPVRMERYADMSAKVMEILGRLSPEVRPISIDEAFLDMGGTGLLWGGPEDSAKMLKAMVREETGLCISVGVASNRYVAKIASGIGKPDGLVIVPPGGEEAFMLTLPLSKLWGAGQKTQERLGDLGILSMADLAALDEAAMRAAFGEAGGRFLHSAARGRDLGIFEGSASSRGMSTEVTFENDVVDREVLEAAILEMGFSLLYRLWHGGFSSRTLGLKLRFFDFTTLGRRLTRAEEYRDSNQVREDGIALLDRAWNGRVPIRLLGLAFSDLSPRSGPVQGELFPAEDRRKRLEETIFGIEERGLAELRPARLLGRRTRGGRGPGGESRGRPGDGQ